MGKNNKKPRQPNIELLRILSICGVIVLHYTNPKFAWGGRACKWN